MAVLLPISTFTGSTVITSELRFTEHWVKYKLRLSLYKSDNNTSVHVMTKCNPSSIVYQVQVEVYLSV